MSLSEDLDYYHSYSLECYEALEGPPLIKKKSRLIAAVVQNQVDLLMDLLDSPKWYNVRDKWGYNLLQIAILQDNKEVFDYMLSIPDFPLEFVNRDGERALCVSLCGFVNGNTWTSEYFAYELIKKGVCIDKRSFDDSTPLHYALERSYVRVAKLLMEAGVDVNVPDDYGDTPLDLALMSDDVTEAVTALLTYGAKPTAQLFASSIIRDTVPFLIQESLFLYLCDEYSELKIDLNVLLKLAETKSPLFHEILKFPLKISVTDKCVYPYFRVLCSMSVDYLKMIMQNIEPCISQVFARKGCSKFYTYGHDKDISIENLNVLLESKIRWDVIMFISTLNSTELCQELLNMGCDESTITEFYCFLLSYGLDLDELDLQLIYQKFGYCKLFKIFLHMDVEMGVGTYNEKSIMPIFIYDVNMNLENFLTDPCVYASIGSMKELFSYFAHPALAEMYYEIMADDQVVPVRRNMPKVPLLEELSRNAFRRFFIEKFQITTCRKFFTLLNSLEVSAIFKKIIAYERKLYY